MADDKQLRKYSENNTYTGNSFVSEIHGPANQERINKNIASAVRNYDKNIAADNKEMAAHFKSQIEKWYRDLEHAKQIKQDYLMHEGGGKDGEGTFSNYTDRSWERAWATENCNVSLDGNLNIVFGVINEKGEEILKRIQDITENWVVKGTEESDFMRLQQSAVKQRNNMGVPLDFDVDWEVSKILKRSDSWKVLFGDECGGRIFANDYVIDNQEDIASGKIPDSMLHPDSFDPKFDNRLHTHFRNWINRAFDPDYQTPAEKMRADELIARTKPQNNTGETNTENTQV